MPPTEIEAKLDVPSPRDLDRAPGLIAELGYFVGEGERCLVVDHYLDTLDLDVYRAGWALRLRDRGTRQVLTLKACEAVGADGLAVREEIEEEIEWAPDRAWAFDQTALGGRLPGLSLGKPLTELFELRQERRVYDLSDGEQLWVELSCDRVQWIRRDGLQSANTLELELKQGDLEGLRTLLRRLQRRTGWLPATWSKFEVGVSGSNG
ncbi:MAG: CYTH domain-containing protein [Planctomycetes bacterium]|nr:CYTH domain-containing protein [Planctomycetota bacterium]